MADWGLKISQDAKDVSSTEPRDYVFNSKYGSVKVVKEPSNKTYETITISAASSGTVSIAHGLPFVPIVMLFTELKPGSGHWYCGGMAWPSPSDLSGAIVMDGEADSGTYVDGTYIKIKYNNNSGGSLTVKYYYFIFGDNGE